MLVLLAAVRRAAVAALVLAALAPGCGAPAPRASAVLPDAPSAPPPPEVDLALWPLAGELAAALAPAGPTGFLLLPAQGDLSPAGAAALEEALRDALVTSDPRLDAVLRGAERDALLHEAARRGPGARERLLARLPELTGCRWTLQPIAVSRDGAAELVVRAEGLLPPRRVLTVRHAVHPASLAGYGEASGRATAEPARPLPSAPPDPADALLAEVGVLLTAAPSRPLGLDDPLAAVVPPGAEARVLVQAGRELHVAVFVTSGSGRLLLVDEHGPDAAVPGAGSPRGAAAGSEPPTAPARPAAQAALAAGERRLVPGPERAGLLVGDRPRQAYVVLSPRPLRDDPALATLLELAEAGPDDLAAQTELHRHLASLVQHGEHTRALLAALDTPLAAPFTGAPPLVRSPALRHDGWGRNGVERTVTVTGRGATVLPLRLLPAR